MTPFFVDEDFEMSLVGNELDSQDRFIAATIANRKLLRLGVPMFEIRDVAFPKESYIITQKQKDAHRGYSVTHKVLVIRVEEMPPCVHEEVTPSVQGLFKCNHCGVAMMPTGFKPVEGETK